MVNKSAAANDIPHLHPWGICVCNMKTIKQMLSEISSGNWTYHPPSIKVNNGLKIEGQQLGPRSQPPKGTSTPPEECVCAVWKQSSKHFGRYRPETELIIQNQIKSIIASKSKVKKLGQRYIYTPSGMCACSMKTIQYNLCEIFKWSGKS